MFSRFTHQRPVLTPCQPGSVAQGRSLGTTPDQGVKRSHLKSEPMGALPGENKGQKAINHGYPSPRR